MNTCDNCFLFFNIITLTIVTNPKFKLGQSHDLRLSDVVRGLHMETTGIGGIQPPDPTPAPNHKEK